MIWERCGKKQLWHVLWYTRLKALGKPQKPQSIQVVFRLRIKTRTCTIQRRFVNILHQSCHHLFLRFCLRNILTIFFLWFTSKHYNCIPYEQNFMCQRWNDVRWKHGILDSIFMYRIISAESSWHLKTEQKRYHNNTSGFERIISYRPFISFSTLFSVSKQ